MLVPTDPPAENVRHAVYCQRTARDRGARFDSRVNVDPLPAGYNSPSMPDPTAGALRSCQPRLSIVVVVHDMEREAQRTLHSLSAVYQRGVKAEDYEVLVLDNGSSRPFHDGCVAEFGSNFSYHAVPDAPPSPARALNLGAQLASADLLGFLIDGARLLSPGVLRYALAAAAAYPNAYSVAHSFDLGPAWQPIAVEQGYDARQEDELLRGIGWPEDGYRLFEIASPNPHEDGWLGRIMESGCVFLTRDTFEKAGGYDERFSSPGGGMLNVSMHERLSGLPEVELVTLLGEGSFHQTHEGVTTSTPNSRLPGLLLTLQEEYRAVHGHEWRGALPGRRPSFVGHLPPRSKSRLLRSGDPAGAAAVAAQRASLRRVQSVIAGLDKQALLLHAAIAEREETVAWLQREASLREATLSWLARELGARAATAAALRSELAARSASEPRQSA